MSRIPKLILVSLILLLSACSTNQDQSDNPSKMVKTARINTQLGMAYLQQGNIPFAKQKLLTAIQQAPGVPDTWYSMAYFQEMTNNKEEAQRDYLKAIAVAKNKGESQNNYGTFLCRSGQYQESINQFMSAVQDPTYLSVASAYENAGLCSLKIPDDKAAKHYFLTAFNQDSNSATALLELAKLDYKEGDLKMARQYLELYLKIAPSTPESSALGNKLAVNTHSDVQPETNNQDADGINT